MKYYVCELDITMDGTNDIGCYPKDDETSAMKLFYQKCASLIDNENYQNALVHLVRQDGFVMATKCFKHEVPTVEDEGVTDESATSEADEEVTE